MARGIPGWMKGLGAGAALTLALPASVVTVGLLLPGLAMSLADRSPGKKISRSMLLFGAAGAVAPVQQLLMSGHGADAHSIADALNLLAQPLVLGLAWVLAALGWALSEIMPVLMRLLLDAGAHAKARNLRHARQQLVAAWAHLQNAPDPAKGPRA